MSTVRPRPVWQVESIDTELRDQLEESLRGVIDPELGLNIIQLGLIRDVIVEEDDAHVVMIMTTPFCPYAPALLEAARSKVENTAGKPTTIEMGMQAWDPTFMEEGAGADWGLF